MAATSAGLYASLHPMQTTTPTSHHSVFTGQMPFLTPNQQRQSTEGTTSPSVVLYKLTDSVFFRPEELEPNCDIISQLKFPMACADTSSSPVTVGLYIKCMSAVYCVCQHLTCMFNSPLTFLERPGLLLSLDDFKHCG